MKKNRNIKKFLVETPFTFVIILVLVSYINNLPKGFVFSSGDFGQIINFKNVLAILTFCWERFGLGGPNYLFNYFPYYSISGLLQEVVGVRYIFIFYCLSFLLGSFLAFNMSIKILSPKSSKFSNNFFSFIYAINVYTFNKFLSPSPYLYLYVFLPLIFSLTYKYFFELKILSKTLAFLGLVFFVSNIVWGNPPYLISLNIFLFVFIVSLFFLIWKFKKIDFIKKTVSYYLMFALVSIGAVLYQIPGLLSLSKSFNAGNEAFDIKEWIYWQSLDMRNVFLLSGGDFLDSLKKFSVLIFLPAVIIFLTFLILHINRMLKRQDSNLVTVFLILVVVDVFFLNKGRGYMSKDFITTLFGNNPIFASIRSIDKTLVFLPFFLITPICILLSFVKSKKYLVLTYLLFFLSLVPLYPLFKGTLLTNYLGIDKGKNYKSSEYAYIVKIPKEYYEFSNKYSSNKLEFRWMTGPYSVMNSVGWTNYARWKSIGSDPTIQFFNHPVVQMNSPQRLGNWKFGEAWNEQDTEESKWIFPISGLLNVRYFIYHKDVAKGFIDSSIEKIKKYESKGLISLIEKNDFFDAYELKKDYWLPLFYVPGNMIFEKGTFEESVKLLDTKSNSDKPVIYQSTISKENYDALLSGNNNRSNLDKLVLEFKKENPTKYRVRMHGAGGVAPIVFSESFSSEWKVYLSNTYLENRLIYKDAFLDELLEEYKIIEGNIDSQATREELLAMLKQGLISSLGDGKEKSFEHFKWYEGNKVHDYDEKFVINFVSKNDKGVIQNDNIGSGTVVETWFKKPLIDDNNHFLVNGYANSWVLNTDLICKDNPSCSRNTDGTYDFEIIIEYRPQRLLYVGVALSLLVSSMCLIWVFFTKNDNKY